MKCLVILAAILLAPLSAYANVWTPGHGDKLEFDLEVDRRGKHSAVNLVPVQG